MNHIFFYIMGRVGVHVINFHGEIMAPRCTIGRGSKLACNILLPAIERYYDTPSTYRPSTPLQSSDTPKWQKHLSAG